MHSIPTKTDVQNYEYHRNDRGPEDRPVQPQVFFRRQFRAAVNREVQYDDRDVHGGQREQARGAALQEKGQRWCNRFQARILQVIP